MDYGGIFSKSLWQQASENTDESKMPENKTIFYLHDPPPLLPSQKSPVRNVKSRIPGKYPSAMAGVRGNTRK